MPSEVLMHLSLALQSSRSATSSFIKEPFRFQTNFPMDMECPTLPRAHPQVPIMTAPGSTSFAFASTKQNAQVGETVPELTFSDATLCYKAVSV